MSKKKDVTDWTRRESQEILEPSGPRNSKKSSKKECCKDANKESKGSCCCGKVVKTSLLVSLGVVIGWLAKGILEDDEFEK